MQEYCGDVLWISDPALKNRGDRTLRPPCSAVYNCAQVEIGWTRMEMSVVNASGDIRGGGAAGKRIGDEGGQDTSSNKGDTSLVSDTHCGRQWQQRARRVWSAVAISDEINKVKMREAAHCVFCALCMVCPGSPVSSNRQDCNRQSMQWVQNTWSIGTCLCLNARLQM